MQVWLEREPQRVAGTLLTTGAAVVLLGIITAEAAYSGTYTTTHNTLSDLGADPLNGFSLTPSAVAFDATMIIAGLLLLCAAYALHRAFAWWWLTVPMLLFGVGVIGVGFVPENVNAVHTGFASVAFVGGAVSAITAYRVERVPFKYVSVVLGGVSLLMIAAAAFGREQPVGFLGPGGVERWIVYPVTIWIAAFGGYMLAQPAQSARMD